jgi:carboxyl-terminal processing protease
VSKVFFINLISNGNCLIFLKKCNPVFDQIRVKAFKMIFFAERFLLYVVELVPNQMRFLKIKLLVLTLVSTFTGFVVSAAQPATNAPVSLEPGPYDGRIAYVTARLLEEFQYSQQPLNTEMSKKFFDGYINSLDPRHENFLQSDIDQFSHWRTNLDTLTVNNTGWADLTPAYVIFKRYIERLEQHDHYAIKLLKRNKFTFTGNGTYPLDPRHAPWPQDLSDAEKRWRTQVRYEYLQEKLSREISPTNAEVVLPLTQSNLTDIAKTLVQHYHWGLHMATNFDSTDVLQTYLEALAHAYDPHSDYFNTAHAQQFSIEMSLSLFGIGAQLKEDDGYCTINELVPGGPAIKSKQLKEGDRIIAVGQSNQPPVNVVDMDLDKVVQLIRGPKGTEVRLTISPEDDRTARQVVTLIRAEIKLEDSEAKAMLVVQPNGHGGANRLGVIDLPSFYATINLPGSDGRAAAKSTTADVTKLIRKLKHENVDGIILDLRGNPGGSLEEAIKFVGLFIKSGPVVQARDPDGRISVDSDDNPSELYNGPLIVLVNRLSASAAEISAAALQDYGRAIIVGDTSTFGKGTVQNLNPLRPFIESDTNDPGTIKITIRKFYRITGASTQLKGVASDIVLPDVLSYATDIGESSLDNPLPWDTISSTDYQKLDMVQPYVKELREESGARVATNQDFIYIRQDIARFKKLQAEKTDTLNEEKALKQLEANQARQKARDAERAARKPEDKKIYEITVEDAGKPGLPPPDPMTTTNYVGLDGQILPTNSITAGTGTNLTVNPGTNAVAQSQTNNVKMVIKTLPTDPTLDEAENIMDDYISLLSAKHPMIVKH